MSNIETNDAQTLFVLVSQQMKSIVGDDSNLQDNDSINNTISLIESCSACVEKEYLMSKNELIEDMNTGTLKVLHL